MNTQHKQKGMSGSGWMLVIIVVAVFAMFGFNTVPAYVDNLTIKSICEGLDGKGDVIGQGSKKIKSYILAELTRNGIRDFDPKVIQVITDGRLATISIKYEVRNELTKTMDVVMKFDNKFEVNY